jgi:hypothetical protein
MSAKSALAGVPLNEAAQMGCPEGFEVFIGRMPLNTSEEQLMSVAAKYKPYSVRVLSKPDKLGLMCGFATFLHVKGAQDFITEVNETAPLGGPHTLNIRFADGKTRKKVFIGGLPLEFSEQQLTTLASHYGTVLSVKILQRNQKAPCGFVVFASDKQAEACIQQLDGQANGDGKDFVVRYAKAPEPKGNGKYDLKNMVQHMNAQQQAAVHNTPIMPNGAANNMMPHEVFQAQTQQAYYEQGYHPAQGRQVTHSFPQAKRWHGMQGGMPPLRDNSGDYKQQAMTPSTASTIPHNSPYGQQFDPRYSQGQGLGQLVGQGRALPVHYQGSPNQGYQHQGSGFGSGQNTPGFGQGTPNNQQFMATGMTPMSTPSMSPGQGHVFVPVFPVMQQGNGTPMGIASFMPQNNGGGSGDMSRQVTNGSWDQQHGNFINQGDQQHQNVNYVTQSSGELTNA